MGTFGFYVVTTLMSGIGLVNILEVDSASNLAIKGNQVSGESFRLECSTTTSSYVLFYRSTNITQEGANVGYLNFYQQLTPSCIESVEHPNNYTVSCNSDGSMFTLIIPANNTIEHKTYWRCQTITANEVLDNNVIAIFITIPITGISIISPQITPNNTVTVTPDQPITFECQTTQGRPAANVTWYLDNAPLSGGTQNITPVSEDIVITTGSLTLILNRTADNKVISCRATNYVNMEPVESTEKPVIRVKYPPRIMGHDAIVVEYSTATLRCSAEGVPATYTFYNWTHVAPDKVTVLRSLPGIYMSTTTTLTLSDVNYQDTGYYRCNVSNGIQDYITGTSSTSFDVNLTVRSRPIVTGRQTTPGRKGDNITLSLEFYSNSASPTNMLWYHAGEYPPIYISGSRFETSLTTSTVDLHMYGQTVQLPGFTTSLTVKNSQESDLTIYMCVAVNDVGTTSVDIALVQEGQTESSQEGSITGPIIGALLCGIVIGVLVVLGILCLRGHWRDKGPKEDKTQSSTENQLSTGDQGTPVYTNLELTVTPDVEQGQQYQDLTPNRSATTSEYQTLDITDTVVPDLES